MTPPGQGAVFDTSVLIFLARLRLLFHVPSLFHRLIIPKAVLLEARVKFAGTEIIEAFLPQVQIRESQRVVDAQLGKGEAQAIAVALDAGIETVFLDERRARNVAISLGLVPKGTLGILSDLHHQGKADGHQTLDLLLAMEYRASDAIIGRYLNSLKSNVE